MVGARGEDMMDLASIATLTASSVGLSAGAAWGLSKKLVEHRLAKDLEAHKLELKNGFDRDLERFKLEWKSTFDKDLEFHKLEWQSAFEREKASRDVVIRREVESFLGDRAAEREYILEARKRLYRAIGPLRFQLLLACRDLAGRVEMHGLRQAYSMDLSDYYGKSTLYRIVRPLTLGELIERQIAYADFSVDTEAVDLLRFKKAAFAVFSGSSIVESHPQVNWDREVQHVYFDNLTKAANALIVHEADGQERAMRFHELEAFLMIPEDAGRFGPLPALLRDFSPEAKPLLWIRLVAFGNLCIDYVNRLGSKIGFEVRDYPVRDLLLRSRDAVICARVDEYIARCLKLPSSPL